MATWEEAFRGWAQPPTQSETDRAQNAENMVRNAISGATAFRGRDVRVILQGSYRNRTNIRRESDVDIGVICFDTFFMDLPERATQETFNIIDATYSYADFKNDVGKALTDYFGKDVVKRGTKAFDIKANTYHLDADVAPFFEHRRYAADGSFLSGVELRPDDYSPPRVVNWPEQHYANGNEKNIRTARSYRALVRILKNLKCYMADNNVASAKPITSFLCECLVWNVPNNFFTHPNYSDDLRAALSFLYERTASDAACSEWGEVSELKYLFRPQQKWTRQEVNSFILAAWTYVGFS